MKDYIHIEVIIEEQAFDLVTERQDGHMRFVALNPNELPAVAKKITTEAEVMDSFNEGSYQKAKG